MRKRTIVLYVLPVLVAAGVGFLLGIFWNRLTSDRQQQAQVGDPSVDWPIWPEPGDVRTISVDTFLRFYHADRGKRYRLKITRPERDDEWDPLTNEAFWTMLQCIWQSSPVTTAVPGNGADGEIQLVLKDQPTLTIWIHHPNYLTFKYNGKWFCSVYAASRFERCVRWKGKLAESQFGEFQPP